MLSVGKAHPDKELAETLHELQPNIYKEGNQKPEMTLALTGFEALYGFIGLRVIPFVFLFCFVFLGHSGNFPYWK